jgi:hypothetical protein
LTPVCSFPNLRPKKIANYPTLQTIKSFYLPEKLVGWSGTFRPGLARIGGSKNMLVIAIRSKKPTMKRIGKMEINTTDRSRNPQCLRCPVITPVGGLQQ